MKISEFIKRMEELRVLTGEDVDVAVPLVGSGDRYEPAIAELQWVIRKPLSVNWRSRVKDNTHQIIVVR